MRSSSNSDPVSYWQAIALDASGTATDVGKLVSTLTVPRSRVEGGGGAAATSTVDLPIRGVYCTTAGNAVLQYTKEDGSTPVQLDFTGLVAGAVYPFCPSRQISGDATLIALYG